MRRPSPALIVSIIALVISTSGTAWAAVALDGKTIKINSIPGNRINAQTPVNKARKAGNADTADTAKLAKQATSATKADLAKKATDADRAAVATSLAKIVTVATTMEVAPTGATNSIGTATCPSGMFATGGGIKLSDPIGQFNNGSAPSGTASWVGEASGSPKQKASTAAVYVICASAAATS